MGLVIALSFVAMMLAVVAFCIAWDPARWLKLWNPWRGFLTPRNPAKELSDLLPGIRLRLAMAGVVMLTIAIIMPVGMASHLYHPNSNPTPAPTTQPDQEKPPTSKPAK